MATWEDLMRAIKNAIKDDRGEGKTTQWDDRIFKRIDELLDMIPRREGDLKVIAQAREQNEKRKAAQALRRKQAEEEVRKEEQSED